MFKELGDCPEKVQVGVLAMLLIILVLSVVSLAQCAYISGEDARIQERIESEYE